MAETEAAPPLSDDERKGIIRAVATQKLRDSLTAQIGEIIGTVDAAEAKRAKKAAADAVKAAKRHDVEAVLGDAERETIYRTHVQQLHRSLVELDFRSEAGEEGVDTDRLKTAIEGLEAFDWAKA